MRNDLTDITLVVDRSGSMSNCKTDAEGGVNTFIEKQKKQPGDAALTLVQFDTVYEFVHNGVPIKDVPAYSLEPRGCTALLDAVGRAIQEVGTRLEKTPEQNRPGCVVFVIVTDGHENASREFKREQIKQMIEHQRDKYQWQFTFLGADTDAFSDAMSIGIPAQAAAQYSTQKVGQTFAAVADGVSTLRCARMSGMFNTDYTYSDAQRKAMV